MRCKVFNPCRRWQTSSIMRIICIHARLKRVVPWCPVVNWERPPAQFFKINVDGALKTDDSVRGLGVVIRNDRGELIVAAAKLVGGMFMPNVTELFAIRFGLQLAMDLGLQHIQLESGAQAAIQMAFQRDADLGYEGVLVNEIQVLANSFHSCLGQFRPRTCNRVAHSLAHFALSISDLIVWMEDGPEWLSSLLANDVMVVS
ncbi:hypothetical protein CerSpe_075860 [Prunus speciosa]